MPLDYSFLFLEKNKTEMKKSILLLVFLSTLTTFLFAQNSTFNPPAKPKIQNPSGISKEKLKLLDQHIETFVNQGHVPGGVFMIARKGIIVYNKSFGHHTYNKKRSTQTDDVFDLASLTKILSS